LSDQTISVRGRDIPFELRSLETQGLRYFADNPRINYIISCHEGPVSQETIQEKLWQLETTKNLIRDIEENQGLIEEILVIGDEVAEGNTRLAAYRRLACKYPGEPRWMTIPAKVLTAGIEPEELFFILGTFHIKGKNEWSAYEKAAYIYRMVRELNFTPKDVAAQLGHHANTIQAMLRAYEAMRDVYLPKATRDADDFETQDALRKYSYFEALYRQKDLAKRAEQPGFIEDFSDWVLIDVFPKAESVRSELPKILANKKAQRVFLDFVDTEPESAFEEATIVLYETKPEKVDPFYKAVREFREMLQSTAPERVKEELDDEDVGGKSRRHELMRCKRDFERFCRSVGLTQE
jgi:hypothetical protein